MVHWTSIKRSRPIRATTNSEQHNDIFINVPGNRSESVLTLQSATFLLAVGCQSARTYRLYQLSTSLERVHRSRTMVEGPCDVCGKPSSFHCSGCNKEGRMQIYCTTHCQKQAWEAHYYECKVLPSYSTLRQERPKNLTSLEQFNKLVDEIKSTYYPSRCHRPGFFCFTRFRNVDEETKFDDCISGDSKNSPHQP